MRVIPDGPDRSPHALWLIFLPGILVWLVLYDGIRAYRLRKYPWERPLTKYRKPLKPYSAKKSWWAW
jgi:hypothetical protein